MRDELHGAAAEIAAALALEDGAIDAASRDVGDAAELFIDETLVVAEVKVGLRAVVGHKNLAMLDGVHRAGVNVEIGVKFLHRHRIAARLEKPPQRRGRDALAETRHNAAQYKYILHLRSPLYVPALAGCCLTFYLEYGIITIRLSKEVVA